MERILLSLAIVLGGLASLYGLYVMVFFGNTFAINRIEVEGEWKYLSADKLAFEAGIKDDDNLFMVSMKDVHGRLKMNPWLKSATVRRRLPNTLWIYAEEHRPEAIVADRGFLYVDRNGELFKVPEAADDKDFPVFTGVSVMEDRSLDEANKERLDTMLGILKSFESSGLGEAYNIAEINYDYEKGYSVITDGKPIQISFGYAAYDDAINRIDMMLREVKRHPGRIRYMMANEPERLIVKYQTS